MKSFLCKGKRPIIKWSRLPNNTFFEGKLPEGYSLAVMPSENYVIVDVDKHGDIDGFNSIPIELEKELENTLHYKTKNDGMHFWFKYTGNKDLANKASGVGIDLRVGNKGYVIWYPKKDIRDCLDEINETSLIMNKWLEKLFSYVDKK
jgi:hypothetical protein